MTTPAPGPASPPSAAERLARTLALSTAVLALATVALVEVGLVRELLGERDLPVVFAAATVAVVAAAVVAGRRLARHLRRGPGGTLRLPAEQAKPTVPVAFAAAWTAAGFAGYPGWSDWFFAAASGVFVAYFLVPIVLDRAARRAAPPAGQDEGNP